LEAGGEPPVEEMDEDRTIVRITQQASASTEALQSLKLRALGGQGYHRERAQKVGDTVLKIGQLRQARLISNSI
jgi:hypothetical protein